MLGVDLDRLGDDALVAEAEIDQHEQRREGRRAQQQDRLDDLHPGRGHHAAEHHVADHQHADAEHRVEVGQAEQELDQLAGADELRDQVEGDDGERGQRGQRPHRPRRQPKRDHVREGIFAEPTQRVGEEEYDQRIAQRVADRVDEPVEPRAEDQAGQAEERARRDQVAGEREPVLHARDLAAGRVVVGGRARPARRPVGDGERDRDEEEEQGDRRDVEPVRGRGGRRLGQRCPPAGEEQRRRRRKTSHRLASAAFAISTCRPVQRTEVQISPIA